MLAALFAVLASTVNAIHTNASAEYESGALGPAPNQTFKSVSATPALWNFNVYPQQEPADGLIFWGPWGKNISSPGPLIYDKDGEPVWIGTMDGFNQTMTFTPTTYKNQTVLALWQGVFNPGGYGQGQGQLLDQTYSVIANISANVTNSAMDFHEFTLTNNNTALVSVYATEDYDVSSWGVAPGNNSDKIMLGYAQEIDIETGKTLFSWRSLDHVDPRDCYSTPQETGTNAKTAWDYFHINAIDKDDRGNYLISARHCHAVYYVDGKNGSIIWTLGGKNSSFDMGPGTEFSWQHYSRFRANSTISLFDNGGAVWGPIKKDDASSARAIHMAIDEKSMTTKLLYQALPYNHSVSNSQGSMDLQPNGNWLIGWGSRPYLSEYAPTGQNLLNSTGVELNGTTTAGVDHVINGTLLWSAQFGVGEVQNYRVHRSKWQAYPKTIPDITAVSNGTGADLYVSWNGATEVATWEIRGGDGSASDPSVVNATRTGFETRLHVNSSAKAFQAVARNVDGSILGFSSFVDSNGTKIGPPTAEQSGQIMPAPNVTAGVGTANQPSTGVHTATVSAGITMLAAAALVICAM